MSDDDKPTCKHCWILHDPDMCPQKPKSELAPATGSPVICPPEFAAEVPKPIMRPCDHGLRLAISQLETQLGTIEGYNRLVAAAKELRAKIDAGKAEAQNPCYTTDPRGGSLANC